MSEELNKRYLQCARSLGAALRRYAKDRRDEDKKFIQSVETELCQIHRAEQQEQQQ